MFDSSWSEDFLKIIQQFVILDIICLIISAMFSWLLSKSEVDKTMDGDVVDETAVHPCIIDESHSPIFYERGMAS